MDSHRSAPPPPAALPQRASAPEDRRAAEDRREATANLVAFFTLLAQWDRPNPRALPPLEPAAPPAGEGGGR